MNRTDFKKELKQFYGGRVGHPAVVDVPAMNYPKIDGHGDPNTSQEYVDAIQALYPVAYTIKFMCKKELGEDFAVMPLEGLWWAQDMRDFSTQDKSNWLWTAMIMQPDLVTIEMFARSIEQVATKKNPPSLEKVRFEALEEGHAAQVLYVGAYADEGPAIQQLHAFINEQGGLLDGTSHHHHEIYLSDPRRTDAAKLKTIIRQPFSLPA